MTPTDKLASPTVTKIDTGYTLISWNCNQWAQIPTGFCGEKIPDEMIFKPEWNRGLINEWWRKILLMKWVLSLREYWL